jgi:hypothetical protein
MQNGKVIRAAEVREDGEWLILMLTGGHTVGIERRLVTQVENDLNAEEDAGLAINRVTGGRDYAPQAGFRSPRDVPQEPNPLEEHEEPASPPEQPQVQTPVQQPTVVAPAPGRRGRTGARTWPRQDG